MTTKLLLFLSLVLLCYSCSYEMTERELMDAIIDGDGDAVHSSFYKDYRIDKDKMKKVVAAYSEQIKAKDLKAVAYKDAITYRKREKLGYLLVDKDNYIHYTVTFKYTTMEDGEQLVNFMDFRAAEHDINSIQFPSLYPLHTLILPISERPGQSDIDSIKQAGPQFVSGIKLYHNYQLNPMYMLTYGDDLKKNVISFNLGNKFIKDNLETILSTLSTKLNIEDYTLAYYEDYAQPTVYLGYERGYPQEMINAIQSIITKDLGGKVKKRRNKSSYRGVKFLDIGGINGDPRRRFRF